MSAVSTKIPRLSQCTACLAGALALAPAATLSTSRVVNNCEDDGSIGSLRQQVSIAGDKDTIDLSTAQLTCSTITLGAGEINVTQPNLYFLGPASRTVTITTTTTGSHRRLLHQASGSLLQVENLTLSGGYYYTYSVDAKGGCINAQGFVYLKNAVVTGCEAYSRHGLVAGGAIYASAAHLAKSSVVRGSLASAVYGSAHGGGFSGHLLQMEYSTLSGNTASALGPPYGTSRGGGAYLNPAGFVVQHSVIDSNNAQQGGGIFESGDSNQLYDSTVSSNTAAFIGAGIIGITTAFYIQRSTIAFNSAPASAGLYSANSLFRIGSSIVARNVNTSPGGFADVYLKGGVFLPYFTDNLIVSCNVSPAAGVIVSTADPQLAPLANHGGPTRTHALLATSPAINHGSPTALTYDQRGSPFARVVNGTDIGAYERQVNDDEIFYNGFN